MHRVPDLDDGAVEPVRPFPVVVVLQLLHGVVHHAEGGIQAVIDSDQAVVAELPEHAAETGEEVGLDVARHLAGDETGENAVEDGVAVVNDLREHVLALRAVLHRVADGQQQVGEARDRATAGRHVVGRGDGGDDERQQLVLHITRGRVRHQELQRGDTHVVDDRVVEKDRLRVGGRVVAGEDLRSQAPAGPTLYAMLTTMSRGSEGLFFSRSSTATSAMQ